MKRPPVGEEWLTFKEAAERLELSDRRVWEYCAAGHIRTKEAPPNGARGRRPSLLSGADCNALVARRVRHRIITVERSVGTGVT